MKLADCKVGDVIKVFLLDNGFSSVHRTGRWVTATIFGHSPEDEENDAIYYLGWRENETRPDNARPRMGGQCGARQKLPNHQDFKYRILGYSEWDVEESDPPASLPQWKLFVNNKEGECPCGTNRSVCRYHG